MDFVRFSLNVPSVTFAQLAACVPKHESEILDGVVQKIRLKEFIKKVKDKDIVAISIHSSIVSLNAELNVRLIKKIKPDIKIIAGGHHPSIYHREWLEKGVDFVIRKEGEITFKELIETIEADGDLSKVEGISYKVGKKIIVNPDRSFIENLDNLPMPRWELINYKRYNSRFMKKGFTGSVETSRGCPFKCHFCLVSRLWNQRQRFKSAERVIEELKSMRRLGINKFYFVDDNFGANYERDITLCKKIIEQKLDIQWMAFSRTDYIKDYPDLYELAAKSGLKLVLTGFETMTTKNISLMNKGYSADMTLEDYKKIYQLFRKNDIFTLGLFVIGYPGEPIEDIKFTLAQHSLVCDYPLMTPFRPARTTKAYELVKDSLLDDMFYHDSQVRTYNSEDFIIPHRNFILKYCLNPATLLKIFNRNGLTSSFFRSLYNYLFHSFCNISFDCMKDFYYILHAPKLGKRFYQEKIVKRYLKKYENIVINA